MKKLSLVLFGFAILAPALCADTKTGTHVYVEPSVVYASIGKDFKDTVGGALAIGIGFAQHHAIELAVMNFKTKEKTPSIWFLDSSEIKLTPVLASYKYALPVTRKLSLFGGLSAGVTVLKSNLPISDVQIWDSTTTANSTLFSSYVQGNLDTVGSYTSISDWFNSLAPADTTYTSPYHTYRPFTYGGQVGLVYTMTQNVAATLGATVLQMAKTDVTTRGSYTTVQLGLRYSY